MIQHLKPVAPPYSPVIEAALARYPRVEGQLLSLFATFANSERFLKKGVPNLLDRESPLPLRIREIVILRVTAQFECAYEWGVHAAIFAKPAALTPEQIHASWAGSAMDPAWPDDERALIKAIDALCARGQLEPTVQKAFLTRWSNEQQLEILALVGAYHTISLVANLARLPPEAFAVVPPD
jgi:alkylhydroperoxidase family enzyme